MKTNWDVIVIGAGPAGSTAAGLIAEAGFEVLLVEKDNEPGKGNSCAGGMALALAEKLKLDDKVIEKMISGCTLYFNTSTSGWRVKSPRFVTVYRRVFDKFLAEQAVDGGVTLLTSTRVVKVDRRNNKITVGIKNLTAGSQEKLVAKLVVFADGINTLAQKTFGIGFKTRPGNTFLGLTYELEAGTNTRDEFEAYFDRQTVPWGCYWIFPKKDRINVGVACIRSQIRKNLRQCLDDFIESHRGLKERKKLRFTAGLIPLSMARTIVSDNCLVIGDAAGMVNPLTGGGLVFAVKSGRLAAKTCVIALKKGKYTRTTLFRYPVSFWCTRHFCWLKILHIINKTVFVLSGLSGKCFYPTVIKWYAFFFKLLPPRFIKNI